MIECLKEKEYVEKGVKAGWLASGWLCPQCDRVLYRHPTDKYTSRQGRKYCPVHGRVYSNEQILDKSKFIPHIDDEDSRYKMNEK